MLARCREVRSDSGAPTLGAGSPRRVVVDSGCSIPVPVPSAGSAIAGRPARRVAPAPGRAAAPGRVPCHLVSSSLVHKTTSPTDTDAQARHGTRTCFKRAYADHHVRDESVDTHDVLDVPRRSRELPASAPASTSFPVRVCLPRETKNAIQCVAAGAVAWPPVESGGRSC